MSALKVYYLTLKKLADEGNAEASLALTLGENVGQGGSAEVTRSVCAKLTRANSDLGEALRHNDVEWSRKTDRAIERARCEIAEALSIMAQR